MKVIITGAGFENKGAEAMCRTVQAKLAERIPDIEFFLWRIPERERDPAVTRGLTPLLLPCDHRDSLLCWPRGKWVSQSIWSALEMCRHSGTMRFIPALFSGRNVSSACSLFLRKKLGKVDAVVDISGFAYGDAWGSRPFKRVQPLVDVCAQLDIPMIFLPQAWGSFDKPKLRSSLRKLLGNQNTVFYSRGERSCRYLESALGKTKGSIPAYPDIAFAFNGGSPEQGREILRRMGCSCQRPIVGVSPSLRVYERHSGEGKSNAYLQALIGLIRWSIDKFDVDVVLQANEISLLGKKQDDRYLCGVIRAGVARNDRCLASTEVLSAEETKALIGRFDFLVSSRYHSSVFGFSEGIPGMAVSGSHKYKELFSLFEAESCVQDCMEVGGDTLRGAFNRAWEDRRRSRALIERMAPRLREKVECLFDEVRGLILKERVR